MSTAGSHRLHELPEQIYVTVTIGHEPLQGAFVSVALPTWEKNPYRLMFGPADAQGGISIDRADLEREIALAEDTGAMDYAGLANWTGELLVAPFDHDAVDRALVGHETWEAIPDLYPEGFQALMHELAGRLAAYEDPPAITASVVPEGTVLRILDRPPS